MLVKFLEAAVIIIFSEREEEGKSENQIMILIRGYL